MTLGGYHPDAGTMRRASDTPSRVAHPVAGKSLIYPGVPRSCMSDSFFMCPRCSRTTNAKGTPFTSREQVIKHVDGSHDQVHDVAGEELRDNIISVNDSTGSNNEGTETTVNAEEQGQQGTRPAAEGKTCRGCGEQATIRPETFIDGPFAARFGQKETALIVGLNRDWMCLSCGCLYDPGGDTECVVLEISEEAV